MEIILKQTIPNLGYKDDLVTVKDGYGRNYLIPKGMAILATTSAKKMREETLRQRSHKEQRVLDEANAVAAQLVKAEIRVGAKVGESGKIFGSVNTVQLAEALQIAGLEIDRKTIVIKNEPIKEVGTYEAEVVLHRDVKQIITFEVIEE
ncbi:MAG: 50S ribosomal protein L9 [Salibacteraceae bacterium]